ncbi:MAG: type IV secretion system DNA-binding domain-containing protein [Parcubacteria group bacterium]|nr:type IV secretion system DNA-binding domain-containing protein [Parcubacteria group bacterium]
MDNEKTIYFAKYDYRGQGKVFGIKPADRSRHVYVVGKTGMGKSTMLENMAVQDIRNGNGMAFIDPHGATAETLLDYIPEDRINDVIYFAPFDIDHPISFNVMEDVGYDKRHLVASGLMSAFKKIWQDAWSARMEYILTNTLLALLEYPDSTLIDVNKMLIDKEFRKKVLEHVQDPIVKAFWVEEFSKYTDRYTQEATPAIQNKIGQFVSNPLIRNIIGQKTSSFDFRKVMDEKKILIMNLSKGRMGDTNTQLLGSMLVIKIYLAAMSRADLPPKELQKLPNFYFFVDEFQSFANETFADILSEARKYKLNLTIAHQYIEQMPEEVRDAVFGNVGTMIVFRVGAFDAEVLEKEFAPVFTAEDIVNLGFAQVYLKLMIDGLTSKPFSATTLPPLEHPEKEHKQEVIEYTRTHYAKPRVEVEESIRERSGSHGVAKPASANGFGAAKSAPAKVPDTAIPSVVKKPDEVKSASADGSSAARSASVPPPPSRNIGTQARRSPPVAQHEQTPARDNRSIRGENKPHDNTARREFPRPRVEPPKNMRPPVKKEEHPQAETHKPFAKVFTRPESRPAQKDALQKNIQIDNPQKTVEPVSLKFLQSNKKDARSPEHLSELRKALDEALKNGNKPEETVQEAQRQGEGITQIAPPSTPSATAAVASEVKPRRRRMRPASANGFGEARGSVSLASEHLRGEIPEDTLRNMLKVEE